MNDLGGANTDVEEQILNHIRASEGTLANPWLHYGGKSFVPGSEFPNFSTVGPSGRPTSASGPFQWERGTWEQQAQRLGLTNFASMRQQNLAAWDLASTTYRSVTGRDLIGDYKKGNVDWGALGNVWTSLRRPAVASTSLPQVNLPSAPNVPMESMRVPELPVGAEATTPPTSPSALPTTDMQRALAIALAMPHFSFTPVKYNPFAGMGGEPRPLEGSGAPPSIPNIEVPRGNIAGGTAPTQVGSYRQVPMGIPRRASQQEPYAENFLLGPLMHPEG